MRCLKAFGERIASRDPDRQTAEIHIRIVLMNRFNALGTAEIEPVAGAQRRNGRVRKIPEFCNNSPAGVLAPKSKADFALVLHALHYLSAMRWHKPGKGQVRHQS